jgi:hypothetical protein
MLKILPPVIKASSVLLLFFISQINSAFAQRVPPNIQELLKNLPPDTLQKMIKDSQPKGEITWTAIPPQQAFRPPPGAVASFQPGESWFQSGSAIAYELDKCVVDGKETPYVKNVFVFYIDEEKLDSTLTTNQRAKIANIKLNGKLERYRGRCNDSTFTKAGGGKGNIDFNFTNTFHIRPRLFQSNRATGKISGAGLNETMQGVSQKGEPIASSYAKSENKSSYDSKLLDALRKAGFPIPDIDIEQTVKDIEAQAQSKGYTINTDKHSFYGRLYSQRQITVNGNQTPAVMVDFGISSGFEADMLVYRPKALTLDEGDTSSAVSRQMNVQNKGYFQNASFLTKTSNYLSNFNVGNRIIGSNQQKNSNIGSLIPDSQQDRVQAFVNLDNDDNDEEFDRKDNDVAGGDNDLIKIVLRVKVESYATKAKAKLSVGSGDKDIKIWLSEDKKKGEFTKAQQNEVMAVNKKNFPEISGDIRKGNLFYKKYLWIEGIRAQTSQKQTHIKFEYWQTGETSKSVTEKEDAYITIIGIKEIEWLGKNNGVNTDVKGFPKRTDKLDTDPNHKNPKEKTSTLKPEGVRVFPGKGVKSSKIVAGGVNCGQKVENVFDQKPQNIVDVKVSLSVEPVEPVNVYFESFDVDDPTANGDGTRTCDNCDSWVDNENKATDNRGEIEGWINPKAGRFIGEDKTDGILKVEFDGKEKTFPFEVTMQPGDNFRIVGNSDRDFLKNLENDDKKLNIGNVYVSNEHKQRIIDRYVLGTGESIKYAEIKQSENYASKTLTVWRVFYGELDAMQKVQGNSVSGIIVGIEHLSDGNSRIKLNKNISRSLGYEHSRGVENSFENGYMTVDGRGHFVIRKNTAVAPSAVRDSIIVDGKIPENFKGRAFEIFDDDKEQYSAGVYHFGNGGVLWQPSVTPGRGGTNQTGLEERFEPTYIVPDFVSLKNSCPSPPFVLNTKSDEDKDLITNYWFDNFRTHKSNDIWTVYVLGAFQGTTLEDGDPNSEGGGGADSGKSGIIGGIADKQSIGVHIFYVGVLEKNGGDLVSSNGSGTGEQDVVVHEIGHLFGAQHGDGGLMDQKDRLFTRKSIAKIRKIKHP